MNDERDDERPSEPESTPAEEVRAALGHLRQAAGLIFRAADPAVRKAAGEAERAIQRAAAEAEPMARQASTELNRFARGISQAIEDVVRRVEGPGQDDRAPADEEDLGEVERLEREANRRGE